MIGRTRAARRAPEHSEQHQAGKTLGAPLRDGLNLEEGTASQRNSRYTETPTAPMVNN